MKNLVQEILEMKDAGFSIETIAWCLRCEIELVEQAIKLINEIEQHHERVKP